MSKGYSDVLIGTQFGDEGKARVIDVIGKNYDIIARFNGGPNAGHTIETKKGRIVLHQIPSGIFYPKTILYIGSGCVLNIEKLSKEISDIENFGVKLGKRLRISSQASIIQPHHILVDGITGKTIGTTKNGIGPAYADKALRIDGDRLLNIRMGDLLENEEYFLKAITTNLEHTLKTCQITDFDTTEFIKNFRKSFALVKQYIEKDTLFLNKQAENGKKILFEGAQSFMLDITRGIVPFVTSSNTMAGSAYVGGDLSPKFHRKTIGIAKAIMSRVGNGPFVSEYGGLRSEKYCMEDEGHRNTKEKESKLNVAAMLFSNDLFDLGRALRLLGNEYGASTGRPRRVGMLDFIQLKYAVLANGIDELWINKCDLLTDFTKTKCKKIPVVVEYQLGNGKIDYVPSSDETCRKIKPVIEYKTCFSGDISKIKSFAKLPKPLTTLLLDLERSVGCKLLGVGVGAKRDQFVLREK